MRSLLGTLLLILGTVLGGLAAANSAKATRSIPLEAEAAYPGEFLSRAVADPANPPYRDEVEDVEVVPPPLVEAGTELTADVVATLLEAGYTRAIVRDPPIDRETLATADPAALEGRMLAEDVVVGRETYTVRAEREVSAKLLARCAAAGVTSLTVRLDDGALVAVPTAPLAVDPPLAGEEAAAAAERAAADFAEATAAALEDGRVAADVELVEPVIVDAGSFLDAPTIERLVAADLAAVDVRIVKGFRLAAWDQRWVFLLAVVSMVLGVVVKRVRPAEAATGEDPSRVGAAEVRRRLTSLIAALEALVARSDALGDEELHDALDEILLGDVYAIVEARKALVDAYGMLGFAAVMSPFAAGERALNRAWSASVDGYHDEAKDALRRGLAGMRAALEAFPPGG